MNKITIDDLLANGFEWKEYKGQPGLFLTKTSMLNKMPALGQRMIDDDWCHGDMEVVVEMISLEICPDAHVQFCIHDADYFEDAVPFDSEEGQSLLRDMITKGANDEYC